MFDKYCIDLESSVLLIVMGRSCIFTRRSGILPSSYPKSMIPISTTTGWWAFAYCLVCDDVVSGTVAGKIRRVIESFVIKVERSSGSRAMEKKFFMPMIRNFSDPGS
ncbi:hypothetical protein Ac2012v2_003305 [Leucoagaricus gongylophorus]